MKITIEFENPCELVDLLRKLSAVIINDEPISVVDFSFKGPHPTMYTEQDETPISHDHTKVNK